jgi:hypothetical protein
MIKIAEIWGGSIDRISNELEESTVGVSEIVLDFLHEVRYVINNPAYYRILEIAERDNIPVTIVTPCDKNVAPLMTYSNNVTFIHWETFWLNRTFAVWKPYENINKKKNLDMSDIRNGEFLTDFMFPYITLNNIAKNHRCLVMDILAKHNLIDKGAISWRDILRSCDDIRSSFPEGMTDSMHHKYPYQYWKPKRLILDQDIDTLFLQETLPIEFSQSFMQLVTESDDTDIFFSEKTMTPILLNKPFLVAGSVGHHMALKSHGFVLYDEIFDYSFDTEGDIKLRYEILIENVKRITTMNLKNLHNNIFDKLVYNKKHAFKLISNIPNEVISLLERIHRENHEPYFGPLNMFL